MIFGISYLILIGIWRSAYHPSGSRNLMIFKWHSKLYLMVDIESIWLKKYNNFQLVIKYFLDEQYTAQPNKRFENIWLKFYLMVTIQSSWLENIFWYLLGTILFYCFKKVVKFWLIIHMECYWFRNFNDIWLIFQRFIWCWTYSSTGCKSLMKFKILFNDRHLILWFKNI